MANSVNFKGDPEDLRSMEKQCKANAPKPVESLDALVKKYEELGAKYQPMADLAASLKEIQENAKIIQEAYEQSGKIFGDLATQIEDLLGSARN